MKNLVFITFLILTFGCVTQPKKELNKATEAKSIEVEKTARKAAFKGLMKSFKKELFSKKFYVEETSFANSRLKKYDGVLYKKTFSINKVNEKEKFDFSFIQFEASKNCTKATTALLSSIGDLQNVEIGKDLKHLKSAPIFAILNSNEIIAVEYACNTNADEFLQIVKNRFKQKNSKTMKIDCGGPLVWE